ncbi:MAG: putative manganese transporter [Oscillospiraceae bacterium]|nr:putative manganese transporter [Oscillospiraceae bacterium]
MFADVWEIIADAAIDCVKMLPFLFLAYLLIEYIEQRHSQKLNGMLSAQSRWGFGVGALLGIVPQCGFSAMAANLYSSRVITLGTLLAVFLSTSDEAIPILLANPDSFSLLLKLLLVKVIAAACAGFLADTVLRRLLTKGNTGGFTGDMEDCDCHEHEEGEKILPAALRHTLHIFILLFFVTLALGAVVHVIGEETLAGWLAALGPLQIFAAGLVGLIPNCAASVLLTGLLVSGGLSFPAAAAGLCTGAGVGLIVLFRANHNWKENLKITGVLYLFGCAAGLLCALLGM